MVQHNQIDHTGLTGVGGASLGAWTSFTPTWLGSGSNPTIGNGILAGRYKALDSKTHLIEINISVGSTTTDGTGTYSIGNLPAATASSLSWQTLSGHYLDASTRWYVAFGEILAGTTTISTVGIIEISGQIGTWQATQPAAPDTSDRLILTGILEIA